jgi:hypothetical protein
MASRSALRATGSVTVESRIEGGGSAEGGVEEVEIRSDLAVLKCVNFLSLPTH